jgi:hypothetical protein
MLKLGCNFVLALLLGHASLAPGAMKRGCNQEAMMCATSVSSAVVVIQPRRWRQPRDLQQGCFGPQEIAMRIS